jgi:hypothetical protein
LWFSSPSPKLATLLFFRIHKESTPSNTTKHTPPSLHSRPPSHLYSPVDRLAHMKHFPAILVPLASYPHSNTHSVLFVLPFTHAAPLLTYQKAPLNTAARAHKHVSTHKRFANTAQYVKNVVSWALVWLGAEAVLWLRGCVYPKERGGAGDDERVCFCSIKI